MSDSPVVEITALDAKALRELVEGLMAANRALEARVAALEAAGSCRQAVSVPTCWPSAPGTPCDRASPYPYTTISVTGGVGARINFPQNLPVETCEWWGDPNDAPCPPPASAN